MDAIKQQIIHPHCTDAELEEIKKALHDRRDTPTGRIRPGDVLRNVLLSWARGGLK